MGAEIARIEGRVLDAEHLYEQAIRSAHENGFVHNEALANELAARFYAARGFEKIAHLRICGTPGTATFVGAPMVRYGNSINSIRTSGGRVRCPMRRARLAPVEYLDLATVIKVSQAVSGEMVLEKLIDTLMRAAIEHAGAERGLLILPRGDEYRIEAEATASGETVTVGQRQASVTAADLPELSSTTSSGRTRASFSTTPQRDSVFCRRRLRSSASRPFSSPHSGNRDSRRCVISEPFSADPYIAERLRSILCLPLINQGKLIGILYLENNLTPRVLRPIASLC